MLTERGWMSDTLKEELMRTWVEEHRLGGALLMGMVPQLRTQWRSPARPDGPRPVLTGATGATRCQAQFVFVTWV